MRIAHITTSSNGGAGIAALRISRAQNEQGIDSVVYSGDSSGMFQELNLEVQLSKSVNKLILSKFVTLSQKTLVQRDKKLVTPISLSTVRDLDQIIQNYDLVHIHATYNLLNLMDIFKIAGRKPVVITLHDERMFTGGCHYSIDCQEFKLACSKCPQVRLPFRSLVRNQLHEANSLFKLNGGFTFVSPSEWLKEKAQGSHVLQGKNIIHIYNPIPSKFTPQESRNYSQDDSIRIGFFAGDLNNPYKGLNSLLSALNLVVNHRSVNLLLFGKGKITNVDPKIKVIRSQFQGDKLAHKAYNMCDLVVVPSLADNSPSVVSEALMCGVPVVGSKIGGIPEVLNQFGFPTFEVGNSLNLAKIIMNFDYKKDRTFISKRAQTLFSFKRSALAHSSLYSQLI
jgi:glycosyltransferase involved in cell wall biosynthesis